MNISTERNNRQPKQKGFSLIEVLIAMVIMSVGMLGIAGMFVRSMQAGRTSMFQHHAVTLAGDVADRIRANPRATIAYMGVGANNNCVDGGIDCNPGELAANDIFLWDQQAAATLPNGAVNVQFNGGVTPPTYQIQVSWNEPNQGVNQARNYTITIPVFGI